MNMKGTSVITYYKPKKKKEKEKEKHIYLSMCKCQCHSLNFVRKLIMPLLAKGRQKLIKRGKVVKVPGWVLLLFIIHNSVVVKDVYVDNKDKSFLQNGVYQKKSELKMYRSNESWWTATLMWNNGRIGVEFKFTLNTVLIAFCWVCVYRFWNFSALRIRSVKTGSLAAAAAPPAPPPPDIGGGLLDRERDRSRLALASFACIC